jgi:alginate O-acetyltransferase complex protein AlgI
MLFNSFDFLIFFIVVFGLQRILPHRPRNVLLLVASYFFYGCWDWRFLVLIVMSTAVDYACGLRIGRHGDPRGKRLYLTISMVANLGLLGYFKYAGFFVDSFVSLLGVCGIHANIHALHIILPVGISFYTFQAMSYTIDIYRGKLEPVRSFRDFALFVSFFPQLVAGPIQRAAHLLPQLAQKTLPSLEQLRVGAWLILWGLFKKAVIADNLAGIVDAGFADCKTLTGPEGLILLYAFAFQIYGDFSGYTDMARGVAKLMGYELTLNFRLPYLATNPQDFWRRWHISLSSWLRDYLYIPLGGSRKGRVRTYVNLMLTMLLGGLWHGAAWTFAIWGAYQGALLAGHRFITERGWLERFTRSIPRQLIWPLSVLVMFHITCFGWLLFRADSIDQVLVFCRAIFSVPVFTLRVWQWSWVLGLVCAPLFFVEALQGYFADTNVTLKLSLPLRTAVCSMVVLMLLAIGSFGGRAFIYFQF